MTIRTFQEYLDSDDTTKPQAGIPFSVPMRVTDNAKCYVTKPKPYCWGSAEVLPEKGDDDLDPLAYGMVDMCANTVQIPTGQSDSPADICITEYGMPLVGNIASTRPRLGLSATTATRMISPTAPSWCSNLRNPRGWVLLASMKMVPYVNHHPVMMTVPRQMKITVSHSMKAKTSSTTVSIWS